MGISLNNETKSNVNLSNEAKILPNKIWNNATYTWEETDDIWNEEKLYLTNETKSKISLVNENK
jgi:hypothetical protein